MLGKIGIRSILECILLRDLLAELRMEMLFNELANNPSHSRMDNDLIGSVSYSGRGDW